MSAGAPKLEAGATVRLLSGGPVMTIQVVSNNLAYCVWFSETQEVQNGTFELHLLEAASAPEEPPSA